MDFPIEPPMYEKGVLSELQGAWEVLRASVAESSGFEGADRALFHIDEAMSWEVVRRLERMPPLLLLVRNICVQGGASDEVLENLEAATQLSDEVQTEIKMGKML